MGFLPRAGPAAGTPGRLHECSQHRPPPDIVKAVLEPFASRPAQERQAFLDAANEYGNTGLHWAALGGHLDTVRLLVEEGAAPALANDKNYVPLDLASFGGKLDVVDYFLAQSGALESGNDEGLGGAAAGLELEGEEVGDGWDGAGVGEVKKGT